MSISDPLIPAVYVTSRMRKETADTFTFAIEPADGTSSTSFAAGQFNMLYVFGAGEVPISISGSPLKPGLVHTVRAVGKVTTALQTLKPGESIGVRGPFGNPWPVDQAAGSDILMVAGGIGMAPLRSAVYAVLARRKEYGRLTLLYGTRTPGDIIYSKELDRWQKRSDMSVHITVDRAVAGWTGHVGVVTRLLQKVQLDPANTVVMLCGPEIMMRFTVRDLQTSGVPAERIFLSMERNMECAIGFCGHCQFGPEFICKNGPIFPYSRIERFLVTREI